MNMWHFCSSVSPGFSWGYVGASGWPGKLIPGNPDLKWGLIFFLSQAKFASYSLPLQNWVFAKVASGVIQCPSHPDFPQLSGTVGPRATPTCLSGTHSLHPSSALNRPSPPWTGRKKDAPSLADYLFVRRDRDDVKVSKCLSISLYF